MKPAPAISRSIVRRISSDADIEEFDDVLAVEEPLEIRLGFRKDGRLEHNAISITMRTPGDDLNLAAGFLFTEGILKHREQIARIRHCGIRGGNPTGREGAQPEIRSISSSIENNTIIVEIADGVDIDLKRLERHFYTSSSCGVCGKSSIEALHTGVETLRDDLTATIEMEMLHALPEKLLTKQSAFERTGGLHASAIFDLDGSVRSIAEDVGRHNALDKVIGQAFLAGEVPMSDRILMVSGRASFELVQKALMAGIPILAAVGAPSSLAVELAREYGMTLIGFLRGGRFNIYTGEERITVGG